jgi:hypothetical protein
MSIELLDIGHLHRVHRGIARAVTATTYWRRSGQRTHVSVAMPDRWDARRHDRIHTQFCETYSLRSERRELIGMPNLFPS